MDREQTKGCEKIQSPLEIEARIFANYLLGVAPSQQLVARYCSADRSLFSQPGTVPDQVVLDWVRRYPSSLPLLDGAMALLHPTGLLRGKLVAMAAILETTPEYAEYFLQQPRGRIRVFLHALVIGLRAALTSLGGLLLYLVFLRRRAS
jgi:hypothetical protein